MVSASPLRLALLGGFSLRRGNREIAVAASGQRLIALLALHDRPLARMRVAGILWPECSTERSLADLRTALWRVHQSGEPLVTATHSSIGLCDEVDVDVRDLVASTRRLGKAGAGEGTADLDSISLSELSCELLPDWYEEWVQDEREGLRQLRLHALEELAAALTKAGRYADAIQAALAAIRSEPLRETAHRTLIEAHLSEGNWSEARRQFQQCRRLLWEELGVEPSESMRLLLDSEHVSVTSSVPSRSSASQR